MAKIIDFPRGGGNNRNGPDARKRWESIPAGVRNLLADNAYCPLCKNSGAIINGRPFVENGALVLRGRCGVCGMSIARLVDE